MNCWSVVQQAKNALGGDIDTMIVNAGLLDIAKTGKQNPMQLEHLMRVNLLAPFYFMEALYHETENTTRNFVKPRRVIFTSSMAAVTPMRGSAAYCASKAGLEMAVRCWAKELGPEFGFCIMGVAPGTVRSTGMFEQLKIKIMQVNKTQTEPNAELETAKHNQLGRPLSLDEVWMTYNIVVNMTGYEHNGQIWRIS